ncbi:MAG: hypothetical protein JWR09_3765 [Mucilaginibacter sp.]|jgi:hypothetical protein|nr:hypothetical protein [Mucilaginibacter sp.]
MKMILIIFTKKYNQQIKLICICVHLLMKKVLL